jgi:hypothetical protein
LRINFFTDVDPVEVAMVVAEKDVRTVLKDPDLNLIEDAEATTMLLEDRRDVHQILNRVVEAIFQDQEKIVESK